MFSELTLFLRAVQDGRISPDNAVGRYLMDVVSSVPLVDAVTVDKLYNNSLQVCAVFRLCFAWGGVAAVNSWTICVVPLSMPNSNGYIFSRFKPQDLLMVVYLTNLTRTQMSLAEKLSTSL